MILKLIAIAGLLLTGVTGWSLYDSGRPYTVRAYFLSAENLTSNNDVVIGGIDVGSVKSVQLKDGARVGGPPRDGIVSPGKNPAAIGQQQTRRRKIASNGDQAVKLAAALRRARIGKP